MTWRCSVCTLDGNPDGYLQCSVCSAPRWDAEQHSSDPNNNKRKTDTCLLVSSDDDDEGDSLMKHPAKIPRKDSSSSSSSSSSSATGSTLLAELARQRLSRQGRVFEAKSNTKGTNVLASSSSSSSENKIQGLSSSSSSSSSSGSRMLTLADLAARTQASQSEGMDEEQYQPLPPVSKHLKLDGKTGRIEPDKHGYVVFDPNLHRQTMSVSEFLDLHPVRHYGDSKCKQLVVHALRTARNARRTRFVDKGIVRTRYSTYDNHVARIARHGKSLTVTAQEKDAVIDSILRTAAEDGCTQGKWMLSVATHEVQQVWRGIVKKTVAGELGMFASIHIRPGMVGRHFLKIYLPDFQDRQTVGEVCRNLANMRLWDCMADSGFKPDVFMLLQIAGNNRAQHRFVRTTLFKARDFVDTGLFRGRQSAVEERFCRSLFFEKQAPGKRQCGMHCVNNFLQGEKFGEALFNDLEGESIGSDYSGEAIDNALRVHDFILRMQKMTRADIHALPEVEENDAEEEQEGFIHGFIVHSPAYGGHWLSLKRFGEGHGWYHFDSVIGSPKKIQSIQTHLTFLNSQGRQCYPIISTSKSQQQQDKKKKGKRKNKPQQQQQQRISSSSVILID